mmetsp:Transcript_34688/g.81806  ORF Transcript_34688/g.81806 Transcript_34688/m.81806 type:complete len:276 (+) Transcript_34688:67-894(+)
MLDERERQPEMDCQSDYRKETSYAAMQWGSNLPNNNTMPLVASSGSISSTSVVSAGASAAISSGSSRAEVVNDDVKPGNAPIRHDTTHDVQKPPLRTGRWTPDEKILFLYGLRMFGKGRWKKMSVYLPQRSLVQIKSHAQKVLKRQQAGENIFRRLEENYSDIDNLVVQAARQRDALRIAGVKVYPPASTKPSKCATKKKRSHNQTGHSGTPAPGTQEYSMEPQTIAATKFPLHQTSDSSVLAAAALCQLSSIGGNWDKRENKNAISGNDRHTTL